MDPALIMNPTAADLRLIAACHRKAFPNALSSAMGLTYCAKMLEWYITTEYAFIFFLKYHGQCIGYCGGLFFDGTRYLGSASGMIQHSFNEAVRSFILRPWLVFHPEFLTRYKLVAKNIWRRFKKVILKRPIDNSISVHVPAHAGLIVIGVDPMYQGKGFGTVLLKEFENRALSCGYNRLMLSVLKKNHQAICVYQKNGWTISKVEGKSVSMEKILTLT